MGPIIVATAYLTDRKNGEAGGPWSSPCQKPPQGKGLMYDQYRLALKRKYPREAGQKEGKARSPGKEDPSTWNLLEAPCQLRLPYRQKYDRDVSLWLPPPPPLAKGQHLLSVKCVWVKPYASSTLHCLIPDGLVW